MGPFRTGDGFSVSSARTASTCSVSADAELDEVAMPLLQQATGDIQCGNKGPVVSGVVTRNVVTTSYLRIQIQSGALVCRVLRTRLASCDLHVGGSVRFRS